MPYMEILAAALQGLNRAEGKVDQAAARIRKAGTAEGGAPGNSVDLAAEMVNLLVGKEEYRANLNSLQTGSEMVQHTIDILA